VGSSVPTGRRAGGGDEGTAALLHRIGNKKAAMAAGHSILVIAWHLLANACDYADLGGDYFVRRDADRARQLATAQLQALCYQVTLQPLAA
jgi:transposase